MALRDAAGAPWSKHLDSDCGRRYRGRAFPPLARVFEVPLYYWTGVLSVLGMLGCSLIHDASTRLLCAGLIMAAVRWPTAVLLLLQARLTGPGPIA